MSDAAEKLRQELQAAQRSVAELQARLENRETENRLRALEAEENRSALLFMLEDLEAARRKIEQAHIEWMAALDVVDDPIFLHDRQFRILRCNKAYRQRAGMPFHEIIGQPYYEVFPKTGAPLPCCLRAMEKAEEEEEEEEVTVGEAIYRSRVFSIHDEHGAYRYSMHTLEDITESRRIKLALHESEEKFRKISESAQDAIIMMADKRVSFWNAAAERIFGYTAAEALGQELHKLIVPEAARAGFEQAFPRFQASGAGPIVGKVIEVIALRKGGEEFPAELSVSATQFGNQWHAIGIVRDITGRKQAEQALRESEKLYRSLFENMLNGFAYCQMIFEHDQPQDFIYLSVNAAFETLTGLKDVAGKRVSEVIPGIRQSDPGLFEIYGRVSLSGKPERFEIYVEALRQWFWISVYSPAKGYFVAVFDVITERKKAEQTLKKSEALLSEMGRMAKMGGWEFDVQTGQGAWTEEVARIHDMAPEEQTSMEIGIGFYQGEYRQKIEAATRAAIEDGTPYDLELEMVTAKGNHKWVRTIAQPVREGEKIVRVAGSFQDITERKQAEQALRESEEKLRIIFDGALDGILLANAETKQFSISNPTMCRMLGYNPDEIMRLRVSDIHPQQDLPHVIEQFERQLRGEIQLAADTPVKRKDGSVFYADIKSAPVNFGGKTYLLGMFRDITERKQAEIAVQHANRALATLSAVNRTLVRAASEDELLQSICQAIVKQRGYRLAWVGYAQHDESKSIKIMARAGHDEGYLDAAQLTWAETERGMGASGRAMRNGKTQLCQDIANDPHYSPWREAALQRGYAASIALPLGDGEVFGVLNVYAAEANAFTPAEIDLLEEMAGDLAFGVHTLHVRHERDLAQDKIQEQLAQLQDSLEDTMRAIAAIVEMRDPYTAGHQVRVADLAAAIARQMGLSEEQAHVIHLAGTVHDLGKINIPAEILSKPGKISDIEFSLIKIHPQAGYDILKGIDFPWPIADMVLQHHERLDGSGYPQGLKDGDILIEARILAVADVVEAISAHRPYRPGLGIEMALEEITKNRGGFYDPQVVDACVALFREHGYTF